ncbi:SWI5-dependent HO expression protein 4 [Elasticomyces elasticus]|nr:SWI5-dependent HO expression protein 4 [Elasticomyces elasticus]KAK3663940.1 SWI5-dependent HO expression protein 4 [Elasticomyces elasticus]KAK4927414.1 SWI5-dependent HO expression protein 4 [Elasticomyces elasticus]KAK5763378.1 SWI5-dependent HO expression protein 4 [Elasticomyces elasticus]
MTSTAIQSRTAELISQADSASKAGDTAKAASILREASQINPENAEVKRRWLALVDHQDSGSQTPVTILRTYLADNKNDDNGDKARQALNQGRQLSRSEAEEAYDLLAQSTNPDNPSSRVDELLSILLQRHIEARKLSATKLTADPSEVFDQLYDIGDESFRALFPILLDSSLWLSNEEARKTACQHIFRFSLATLVKDSPHRPRERAMRAITHLLAVQPETVLPLIDQKVVDIVLSELDIRLDATTRRQGILATSRMLEVSAEKGEVYFETFVTTKVAKGGEEGLVLAFSAAGAVFPILPQVTATLFLTPGFVKNLVSNLEGRERGGRGGKSLSLEQAALELLSAACVDKACREAISTHCVPWLRGLSDERGGVHKGLAGLVLAKLSGGDGVGDVTDKLADLVVSSASSNGGGEEIVGQAIEGLAYTSLQPRVKEEIAANSGLLRSLVGALRSRPGAVFGCLTIFSNLSAYRPALSDEAKKMAELKAYANQAKPAERDPRDSDKHVTARCRKLLDHDVVAALVAVCKQQAAMSTANIMLLVGILLSLAKEQKHRAKMAQQGGVKVLLLLRERASSRTKEGEGEGKVIAFRASHSLARLLISLNPSHLFSAALPSSSAVSALVPLLSPLTTTGAKGGGEQRDLLPTFEALLALTNLASMPDDTTAPILLLREPAFAAIEELMFSSNTLVQRACVELACNLMVAPGCVAKFADGSGDSKRRLLVLVALTDVEDLATRRAAGGALAALTEWDKGVEALLDVKEGKGVRAVVGMCSDESEEVVWRGVVCLGNLVGAPGEAGERAVTMLKGVGVDGIKMRLRTVEDEGLRGLAIEGLMKLV